MKAKINKREKITTFYTKIWYFYKVEIYLLYNIKDIAVNIFQYIGRESFIWKIHVCLSPLIEDISKIWKACTCQLKFI